MGGTSNPVANSPSNLLLLCKHCHRWIEVNREAARTAGWLVRQGRDPAAVPLSLPDGRWVLLADTGDYQPTDLP